MAIKKKRRGPLSRLGAQVAETMGWDLSSWPQPDLSGENIAATIRQPLRAAASRLPYLPPAVTGFPVGIGTPPATPGAGPPRFARPTPLAPTPYSTLTPEQIRATITGGGGARSAYQLQQPVPGLRRMLAGMGPTPGPVPQPGPYGQMIAGRGYQEPVSPLGTFLRREMTAPTVASPEAEAFAAQIMDEVRAKWAAEPRAPQITRGRSEEGAPFRMIGEEPRAYPGAGFQGDVPDRRFLGAVDALGRPATTTPTRLAPGLPEESTLETPQERMARIKQGIEQGTLATQYGRAGPGELNPLAKYLRDFVTAQAGAGPMPAPYTAPATKEQAAARTLAKQALDIRHRERLAKRKTEMDIRGRMRQAKVQGRPITRGQARFQEIIEGKLTKGEELAPHEAVAYFGPEVGQYAPAMIRATMAQGVASALAATKGDVSSEAAATRKQLGNLYHDLIVGIAPRREASALGGRAGVTVPPLEPQVASISELASAIPQAIADDPLEVGRWLEAQGADPAAVERWGLLRFGAHRWSERKRSMWRKTWSPWAEEAL